VTTGRHSAINYGGDFDARERNDMPNAQLQQIATPTSLMRHAREPRHETSEDRVVLWRLRRAPGDLVCATVFTSYGYALALELFGELIRFEIESNLELLVQKADRLEAWLIAHGWTHANEHLKDRR